MGLNCGCPVGAALPDVTINGCKESLGQVQKVIFQRIFSTGVTKNSFPAASPTATGDITLKASWTAAISATDGTKVVVSPYIQNPETEAGAARTFGGGNQTLSGAEIIIGREPTTFTGILYQEAQSTIAALKQLMCENIGVYLIDENGNIGAIVADGKAYPIPITRFFVGDKNLGGLEEPDSNAIEWQFLPNWSDSLEIIKPSFNPLTEL